LFIDYGDEFEAAWQNHCMLGNHWQVRIRTYPIMILIYARARQPNVNRSLIQIRCRSTIEHVHWQRIISLPKDTESGIA
jgi:hypothetical protein